MRIIAIDWSGAKRGAAKKIWAAEFRDDKPVELITDKDRERIRDYLIRAANDAETIVGLDFAFSFPAWFVRTHANSARALWAVVADQGESWLKECKEPFWGRKGILRCGLGGNSPFRRTEQEIKIGAIVPKSVFQINGAGAVGTGSIRGMKMLHELDPHFNVWPFDGAGQRMIVEIWPRALTGEVKKSDEGERRRYLSQKYEWIPRNWRAAAEKCEDAFDAVVSACVMQKHKAQILSLAPAADPIIQLEGQIWRPQ